MTLREEPDGTVSVDLDSLEDTRKLGEALGKLLEPDDAVGLVGDLGSGKTTLARYAAAGAGVPEDVPVNSPTFTIMNLYNGGTTSLCHLDFYRIDDPEEMEGLALGDLSAQGYAFLVEWYDRFPEVFQDVLRLDFQRTGDNSRRVVLSASGTTSRELLQELLTVLGGGVRR